VPRGVGTFGQSVILTFVPCDVSPHNRYADSAGSRSRFHREFDILRLQMAPALDLGLVPFFREALEMLGSQLKRDDALPGEFLANEGVFRHRTAGESGHALSKRDLSEPIINLRAKPLEDHALRWGCNPRAIGWAVAGVAACWATANPERPLIPGTTTKFSRNCFPAMEPGFKVPLGAPAECHPSLR